MPIGSTRWEGCAVARSQDRLSGLRHQSSLARQDDDEFVFVAVSMPLARPGAGGQGELIDPELGQTARRGQPASGAVTARTVEGGRVARSPPDLGGALVDQAHFALQAWFFYEVELMGTPC